MEEQMEKEQRQVHYLSLEFLMGRLLQKNAFNLGLLEALDGALETLGVKSADLFEEERDGRWVGHTPQYTEVAVIAPVPLHNVLRTVSITGREGSLLCGTAAEPI